MCRLHPLEPSSPFDLAAPELPQDTAFAFHMNFADCASAADVTIGPGDDYKILLRLLHEGGTRVTSDMVPLSVEYILSGEGFELGKTVGPESGVKAKSKKDPLFEQLVESLPWLQFMDFKQEGLTGDDDPASTRETSLKPGELPDVNEDEIWRGLAMLERARIAEGSAAVAAGASRDFVPKVRCGTSELLKSGIAVHAAQGQCTSQTATEWARDFGATTFKATFSDMALESLQSWFALGATACKF